MNEKTEGWELRITEMDSGLQAQILFYLYKNIGRTINRELSRKMCI